MKQVDQANIEVALQGSLRADALQLRFAARLSTRLSELSESLPHDVSARLRFARETALKRASELRRTQAHPVPGVGFGVVGMGRQAALSGGPEHSPWWLKFASLVPMLGLVIGLVLIQQGGIYEQILAVADIDTALLADNLPPSAYSDPGFSEYLSSNDE